VPAGDWLAEPGGLAERLDRLLADAGLGRNELAQRLGWVPSKVSKLTHGQQAPSPDDIDAWCGACGHPEEAATLRALLAEGRTRHRTYQRQARASQAATQRRWAAMVQGARRIRNAELIHIPGLLQTPGYARARLTESARLNGQPGEGIEAAVTERIRRAEVLYSGKQFEFLIYEAAAATGDDARALITKAGEHWRQAHLT
jgi:transcriptional regulator with XRE-family HTH domain